MTMELIQHIELGSAQANITFNSIPTSYDDLKIVFSGRGTDDAPSVTWRDINLRFNGSSSGYSWRYLYGDGSSRASDGNSSQAQIFMGGVPDSATTASTFGNVEIYIPNYRSAVAKSASIDIVTENNATMAMQMIVAGLWSGTDAINSVSLTIAAANLAAGSSATLYGIKRFNTTLSPKATGGAISYDSVNNKWVHAFYTSGTFTPTENLTGVEYLVIAGGGGGGRFYGGGGGAGGYRSSVVGESSGGGASAEATMSLTSSTNYTVTVGAGGAGNTSTSASGNLMGTSGSNSSFNGVTATGGGGGAGGNGNSQDGISGGSGGAGGGTSARSGGAGTANQGYAGGSNGSGNTGGGGGGAGAVGVNGSSGTGGTGGAGVTSSITGTALVRAGGGGGSNDTPGQGGSGVGGRGGTNSVAATAGAINTGSGGGGGSFASTTQFYGEAGGSGVVIIRYSA